MSTRQSRLVYDRGVRPCPRRSNRRSSGKLPDASVADALQRLTRMQFGRNARAGGDGLAIREPTRVHREWNDANTFECNAASDFGSGNTAGTDHAPDIDGGTDAVDRPLPICSNTILPTRH